MKSKNKITKIFYVIILTMICNMYSISCCAHALESSILPEDIQLNTTIYGNTGLETVVAIYDDGSFITQKTNLETFAKSKCPHLDYQDIGSPSIVYKRVSKTQHKRGYKQPMKCTRCGKRVSFRYYGWKFYKHSFNKKNICIYCKYSK